MTKVIKEELEKLNSLKISDDSFTCNTSLEFFCKEFNRMSRMDDNLFTYVVEIPGLVSILCDLNKEDDSKQQMTHGLDVDMEYDPSNVEYSEWLASKFYNHKTMDQYMKNTLWIYWTRGDDKVELTDEESSDSDDGDRVAEIFRIDTNVFDFETPTCKAFKEFNYLLQIDPDFLTKDIDGFKTYEIIRMTGCMSGIKTYHGYMKNHGQTMEYGRNPLLLNIIINHSYSRMDIRNGQLVARKMMDIVMVGEDRTDMRIPSMIMKKEKMKMNKKTKKDANYLINLTKRHRIPEIGFCMLFLYFAHDLPGKEIDKVGCYEVCGFASQINIPMIKVTVTVKGRRSKAREKESDEVYSPLKPLEKNCNLNTSAKLTRVKPDKYSGEADISKGMLGLEQPGELRRSWHVEGHVRSGVISFILHSGIKGQPNKEQRDEKEGTTKSGQSSSSYPGREPIQHKRDKEKDELPKVPNESKPLKNVKIHDGHLEQIVTIRGNLTTKFRISLIEILRKHADAFAWTLADMTGIPYFIAEHDLKTYPHIEPRVQRKRNIALDRRKVVKEEVAGWLKARIGKQHKASCRSKIQNSISQPLFMLHMDLFGPTFMSSLIHKTYGLVVTDDYSRHTWVFFFATKNETTSILKKFITEIENLVDKKVKVIRCDNGTEFQNSVMNDFCAMKGIRREFSVARTPQQNDVAERRNKIQIKASRTMVLVVKPHNKTPYELFRGRTPALSFMGPFWYHVPILNTLDHLGKFNGKSDDGFFVGYSLNSKAFRVCNFRTRKVKENLHIKFLEDKPSIVGINSNDFVGTEESIVKNSSHDEPQPSSDVGYKDDEGVSKESEIDNQEKSKNNTQDVNTAKPSINTASTNDNTEVDMSNITTTYQVLTTPNTRIHKDHSLDHVIGDVQSRVLTRSKLKPTNEQGFISVVYEGKTNKDLNTYLFAYFLSQIEPTRVTKALSNPAWVETMQEELLQFKLQKVWILVDLPKGKKAIGTKWVFRNKKDKRGIMIMNKARLVAQGYTQEEGIDYDEVFAHVVRIETIRLFLAYASFIGFMVYYMDVKSAFLHGRIKEEVYVCQSPVFEDPDHPQNVYKLVKALYGLHQTPRAWYETLAKYLLGNGFHRGKIDQTLFIKRQKGDILLVQVYVDDIIFGSTKKELCTEFERLMKDKFQMNVKLASTLVDMEKTLIKDADVDDVDVHLYKSMIGSLMYLITSRPDIIDSLFELVAYTDSDYAGASLDMKSTTGGCQFLGSRLISWQCKKQTVVATSTTEVEYMAAAIAFLEKPTESNGFEQIIDFLNANPIKYVLTINLMMYTSCIKQFWSTTKVKTVNGEEQIQALVDKKKVIITETSVRSDLHLEDAEDEHVTTTSNDLPLSGSSTRVESYKDAGLGDQEDASKQRRMIADLDADEGVTLVDETQGRNDQDMFDTSILDDEEVVVEKEVSTTELVPTTDEITLAKALIDIKTSKPRAKGIVIQEASETPTPTPIDSSQQPSKAKDKGKAKIIELEKPLKMKDQIMIDEKVAKNLKAQMQAELEEEERLARQKEEEANIALIGS
uniref:Integrase catalytic domain-containing protein n=1 Tax=Tanacetum cinerariifolium TaxID=118510 RepID=A0A6L2N4M1_TANCI|nr:hypothetical protein [Tanacetum cinerariifolium]